MTKKFIVLAVALIMAASVAQASELKGKITSVQDGTVTIEVEKSSASEVSVGDDVEVKVKKKGEEKKAAPKKGRDMLMGC